MGSLQQITDIDFEEKVLQAQTPVIVDFWAEWCMPCKMLAPTFEELSNEYIDKVEFVKMDIDTNPETPTKYNVRSIPTLIIFSNGKPVEQLIGVLPKSEIKAKLDSLTEN